MGDNSDPKVVTQYTEMSKKLFKRSLGVLLKRGEVEATEGGIRIINK
ncbi:MAG: hypothetical protein SNG59_08185 [Rikenellaceae bacterium]